MQPCARRGCGRRQRLGRNGRPGKRLFLNDIKKLNAANDAMGAPIAISHEWVNNLELRLPSEFDLTFVDTWHVYGQLKRELTKFAPLTHKFIVLHDTTVNEWHGETLRRPKPERRHRDPGGEWRLRERFTHNNGLTVLERHPH